MLSASPQSPAGRGQDVRCEATPQMYEDDYLSMRPVIACRSGRAFGRPSYLSQVRGSAALGKPEGNPEQLPNKESSSHPLTFTTSPCGRSRIRVRPARINHGPVRRGRHLVCGHGLYRANGRQAGRSGAWGGATRAAAKRPVSSHPPTSGLSGRILANRSRTQASSA